MGSKTLKGDLRTDNPIIYMKLTLTKIGIRYIRIALSHTFSICIIKKPSAFAYMVYIDMPKLCFDVLIYEQENSHNFLVKKFPKLIIKEETYK